MQAEDPQSSPKSTCKTSLCSLLHIYAVHCTDNPPTDTILCNKVSHCGQHNFHYLKASHSNTEQYFSQKFTTALHQMALNFGHNSSMFQCGQHSSLSRTEDSGHMGQTAIRKKDPSWH